MLGYCGIAFLLQFFRYFGLGKKKKRSSKPMIAALVLVAVVLGGLAIGREGEIRLRQKQKELEWQHLRSQVLDYIDLKKLPQEAIDTAGWTDEQRILLDKWNTMDEAISTQALRSVRENWYNSETNYQRRGPLSKTCAGGRPWFVRTMVDAVCVGRICTDLRFPKTPGKPVASAGAASDRAAMLPVLLLSALKGRLPYRAVTVALLPAAAMVFCLLANASAQAPQKRRSGSVRRAGAGDD